MNAPPGFFRLWMGRIFWGLVVTVPIAGLLLVLLMIGGELRGLDRARTGLSAANSLLTSAMRAGKPESVPLAVRRMALATGTTIILFREDGTPAYTNAQTLERLKAFTPILGEWAKAPHSPDLFPWPSSSLPTSLSHEVDRVFARKSAQFVTNRKGHASPFALRGGFAVWTQAIPNRTACARCHGFDREVLGHWVAVAPITPVATRSGTFLWGFWPLPGVNQQILFGGTAGLVLFSIFLVSLFETWTLKRYFKVKKGKGKKELSGKGEEDHRPSSKAKVFEESGLTVSHEGWLELHERLDTLDKTILALLEEVPRPGVQSQKKEEETISVTTTLGELLSNWSDRFELDLQEIAGHPTLKNDPILSRFVAKAQDLRSQAVSYADMAVTESEEKSHGLLNAPFFEGLSEDHQNWTDRLRAILGHLHAEVRAMEGISKNGLVRTEGPLGEEDHPENPQRPQAQNSQTP